MAERNLKVAGPLGPETETAKDKSAPRASSGPAGLFARFEGKNLRFMLLVGLPALLAMIGLILYLTGGRYITTDNAYVGAQKVLITPDVSGKVQQVFIKEGQHVAAGDKLLEVDPVPYRLALAQAQAKLESTRTDFNNLKTNYKSLLALRDLSQTNVDLKQREVDRKSKLLESAAGSRADVDTSAAGLVTAQLQAQYVEQQKNNSMNQLLGNADLPLESFPAYQQAKAALDDAQRNLNHTTLTAPIAGIATQVDNIQLGRFVAAGAPILSIVDDDAPWVDANPKETDITYLREGQRVDVDVDAFSNRTFKGVVASVSPGTGAQFSILPPQNASGNWVKIVQRVPVRIAFDAGEDTKLLRSGMSVSVSIDTGHSRLFHPSQAAAAPAR